MKIFISIHFPFIIFKRNVGILANLDILVLKGTLVSLEILVQLVLKVKKGQQGQQEKLALKALMVNKAPLENLV